MLNSFPPAFPAFVPFILSVNFRRSFADFGKLEQIEALCFALNGTPNDLLEWKPNASQNVSENHSLNNLKRAGEKDLPALLNEIPLEKFEQIAGILQDLKSE